MICRNCGKEIPNNVSVCPGCGAPVSPRTASPAAAPQRVSAGSQPVSTGDWFVTLLLAGIPLVGLIMTLVWAFGGGANPSKQNWARAMLLWAVVGIVLAAAAAVVILGLTGASFSAMRY